jgi:hypothetical protein
LTSARSSAPPAAVDAFAEALASWLSAFTMPQELSAEMASACSAGAPWAAALAGTSVKRAGWPEREALAWGIAVGALAGALEAGRRSLAASDEREIDAVDSGAAATAEGKPARTADGPALPLLASDGLIAGAHEALSSLDPTRLVLAFEALAAAFGDGGPWKHLSTEWPRPAWPAVVACGLGPAGEEDPDGPWSDLATAWRTAFASPSGKAIEAQSSSGADDSVTGPYPRLGNHPDADHDTNELFAMATRAASGKESGEDDEESF